MNEEKLNYSNIAQWHEEGYKGKGVKIALSDLTDTEYNPNWFPEANIIVAESEQYRINKNAKYNHLSHQLLSILLFSPEAEIHIVDTSGTPKLQYLIDNDIDIYTHSTTLTWNNSENNLQEETILGMDNVLFTASGNTSDGGFIVLGNKLLNNKKVWFSIGACDFINGGVYRESYSCYNKLKPNVTGLFFSNFIYPDGTHTGDGTSFSSPSYAALYSVWRGAFKQVNNRKPTYDESLDFIISNSELIYDEAAYSTGYGILIMPDVNETFKKEEENMKIKVTAGSNIAYVDGIEYSLVEAPIIYNGRLMLSFKDIALMTGGSVISYDNTTKTAEFNIGKFF